MLPLLDGVSQDAVESLADEPPPGSLLVLACRVPGLASAAARLVGRRMLGARASRADLLVFTPAGESWLVEEVEAVVTRLRSAPEMRHFLVLESAWALPQRSADRLLKVVEEPPAPTSVVLVCRAPEELPATLRGRAAAEVVLSPAPAPEQVAALVSGGVSPAAAREAVALAGSHAEWAPALARSAALRAVAREVLVPRLDLEAPSAAALSRLGLAARLASGLSVDAPVVEVPEVGWEDLSSAERVVARRVLREFVAARRRALVGALGRLDADGVATVAVCVAATERFESRLAANVPPALALAALAAESPPLRLPR